MRMYDLNSGLRFDMNHPLWPTKEKGGEKYLRPPKAVIDALVKTRKISLVPSVSDIISPLKTGSLIEWALKLGAEVGRECGLEGLSLDDTMKRVRKERNAPAKKGSAIHDELEQERGVFQIIKQKFLDEKGLDITNGSCEVQFASEHGFGGTCDRLVSGEAVIDYKTTGSRREPYESECTQLVAYNMYFKCPRLFNVYIDQKSGEPYSIHEWSIGEKQHHRMVFLGLLALWKELNLQELCMEYIEGCVSRMSPEQMSLMGSICWMQSQEDDRDAQE